MSRNLIWRWIRLGLFAAAVSMALGSVTWGQDRDDYSYRRDEAREHGYRNGYRDGSTAGRYAADNGRRFNFKNDDWEDSRGFEHWMGSKGRYKQAYREGYERGYRRAYGDNGYRRDHDRDDYRGHDRDDWR